MLVLCLAGSEVG